MKQEPGIVKKLREEEESGKLYCKFDYFLSEETKISDPSTDNPPSFEVYNIESQLRDIEYFDLNELYKTIFENCSIAIILIDKNERIFKWNKFTEKLLNMNANDLFMTPIKTLYPSDEWKKIQIQNMRHKGVQYHLETKIFKKNEKKLEVKISISVLKNHINEVYGSIYFIRDISKYKEIENRFTYEYNLIQTLVDNFPDPIYFKDDKSRFIKVNKAKANQHNKTQQEMIGKTDFDFLPYNEAEKAYSDENKVRETGKGTVNKIELITDGRGAKRWLSVIKIPYYDYNGKIVGTIGISHDITSIRQAAKKITKLKDRYKDLFESAVDSIIVVDKDGFLIDMNNQVTKLLGYNKNELLKKNLYKIGILTKKSLCKALNNNERKMTRDAAISYEVEVIAKNRAKIPVEIYTRSLFENKKIIGNLIIFRDLRKRKKTEADLHASEKKFRDIFEVTSELLIYLNEKGIVLDINRKALEFWGLKKADIVGKPLEKLRKLFSTENLDQNLEFIDQIICGEKIREYEMGIVAKDSIKHRFLFSNDILKEKGKIKGILLRGRDVTQRQKAWDELVKLEEKYRILAETSVDGVITLDQLGRLTYINPSFEKMCGRRKSQILATLFREYLSDNSIYLFQQIFIDSRKNNNKIENVELELVHSNGAVIPIEVNIAPLKKDNIFVGIECTVRDITERKRIEEELKRSERLKTEFMNIAAHELKSPVTPIKGYLDLIISDNKSSEKVKNWARISLRNSERLLKLVNDILDVSRLDTDTMRFDMEKLNVINFLYEIVEDMKPIVANKNLKLNTDIPKTLPPIMGDKYRLTQVLRNLMINAVKFTDIGGITLKAKKENSYLIITIEDTGIGIYKEELKKIFHKFYQAYTGEDRKNEGTGLGLFICKEIIDKHQGRISVESEVGKGSRFTITIPHI